MANTITVSKTSHKQKRYAKDYAAGTILRSSETTGGSRLWMVVGGYQAEKALVNLSNGYLGTVNPFVYGEVLTTGAEVTLTVDE